MASKKRVRALMVWLTISGCDIIKVVMLAFTRSTGITRGYKMSFSTSQLSKELNSVSDYFVWKSAQDNKPITNKKIQKLVYYAQAWNLVFNNGDNLFPDPIEAWLHGPAVRKLWHKYKNYGYLPVSDIPKSTTVSDDRKLLLNDVWRVYGKHDAEYLEALTHSEEPWQNARQGLETNENSSIIISNKDMQTYYTKLNA